MISRLEIFVVSAVIIVFAAILVGVFAGYRARAFKHGGWLRGLVILAMVMVICVVAIGSLFVTERRSEIRQYGTPIERRPSNIPPNQFQPVIPPAEAPDVGEVESAWSAVVDESFDADIYPSIESAARALAIRVAGEFADVPELTLTRSANMLRGDEALRSFAQILQDRYPSMKVNTGSEPSQPSSAVPQRSQPPQLILDMPQQETESLPPPRQFQFTGTLRVQIARGGHHAVSVSFVDKPWVDQFNQFTEHYPTVTFLCARSPHFANSPSAAKAAAIDQVADQLTPMVRDQLSTNVIVPSTQSLQQTIKNTLRNRALIADEFDQRLTRPYGDVWRSAVLVDASPQNIRALADGFNTVQHVQRRARANLIFSIAGLCVVVFALYAFLNLVTRGYYQRRLQVILVLSLVTGAALVLLFMA